MRLPLSAISVNGRHRRDLGNVDALAASIADVGLLHPIVVTAEPYELIAGERRLEAVKKLGWPDVPVTVADSLETALDLLKAERDENECRKPFSPVEAVEIGRALRVYEQAMAKARQLSTLKQNADDRSAKLAERDTGETRDKVAAAVGMGRTTFTKAEAVVAAAEENPALFGRIAERMDASGKVDWAFREVQRVKAADKPPVEFPEGKYRVIYADPPWSYGNTMPEYFPEQADHYATMSVRDICALPVRDLALENAVLFLWVTSPILEESFEVISAWGFSYKASFVWDKVAHNMGHYNSVRHELLLVATRGSCQPDVRKLFDSVQTIERGEHSEKPEEFRQIIDTIYPHGPRIELFARRQAQGWEAFGNEVP